MVLMNELVGLGLGYTWFYSSTSAVVAGLEVQEAEEMVMGSISLGHPLVSLELEKQMLISEFYSKVG